MEVVKACYKGRRQTLQFLPMFEVLSVHILDPYSPSVFCTSKVQKCEAHGPLTPEVGKGNEGVLLFVYEIAFESLGCFASKQMVRRRNGEDELVMVMRIFIIIVRLSFRENKG